MEIKKTDCDAINIDIINKVKPEMLAENTLNDLSEFFKVMGDGTRIKILWALDKSEMCVCDIAYLLDMTKSAVSHQLRTLRNARLVKSRRVARHIYYALDDDHIKEILEMGLTHIKEQR